MTAILDAGPGHINHSVTEGLTFAPASRGAGRRIHATSSNIKRQVKPRPQGPLSKGKRQPTEGKILDTHKTSGNNNREKQGGLKYKPNLGKQRRANTSSGTSSGQTRYEPRWRCVVLCTASLKRRRKAPPPPTNKRKLASFEGRAGKNLNRIRWKRK